MKNNKTVTVRISTNKEQVIEKLKLLVKYGYEEFVSKYNK